MPELPEVEIVRRNLEKWARGASILAVEALRPAAFREESLALGLQVVGHQLTSITRRGKALWMATSGPVGWLMRFGMTGKWVMQTEPEPPRFTRVRMQVQRGQEAPCWLCFVDMRNFGGLWGLPSDTGPQRLREEVTGVDPVLEGLTGIDLERAFYGRKRPIKVLLLEQSLIAGVGNIYASEALFRSRIHPETPGEALTVTQRDRLAQEILAVLHWAIEAEAADEVVYQGEAGAVNPFQVYGREKEPCPVCQTPIRRVVMAQRSTFWCPTCQGT